jgi:hypothetical protein
MTDGDHYMNEHLERAGEKLECKFLGAPEHFSTKLHADVVTPDAGCCLDNAAEKLRFGARVIALEKVAAGTHTFWSDTWRCQDIVLLQDRVDQVEGIMESYQSTLMTTLNVMLPRNPSPENLHSCWMNLSPLGIFIGW